MAPPTVTLPPPANPFGCGLADTISESPNGMVEALRQVIERMAHVDRKLSAEAAQFVEAAPVLRSALLHLESLTEIPDALKVRVLSTLERAVGPNRSSFDLENLSTHVFEALKSGPRRLETAIDESGGPRADALSSSTGFALPRSQERSWKDRECGWDSNRVRERSSATA